MMLAAVLLGFNWQASLFWAIRAAVALVACVVGWFLAPVLTRFLYRLAFHRPLPGWGTFLSRLGGALVLGFLAFYYVPLGGGAGWGWGPGGGGGPGLGPGSGGGTNDGKGKGGKVADDKKGLAKIPNSLEIELLGGERYKQDERYYLIERKPPAKTLDEVEDYLKNQKDVSVLFIVLLPEESVGSKHPAVGRLKTLAESYKIKVSIPP